jgi:hypothetical protein
MHLHVYINRTQYSNELKDKLAKFQKNTLTSVLCWKWGHHRTWWYLSTHQQECQHPLCKFLSLHPSEVLSNSLQAATFVSIVTTMWASWFIIWWSKKTALLRNTQMHACNTCQRAADSTNLNFMQQTNNILGCCIPISHLVLIWWSKYATEITVFFTQPNTL